MIQKALKQKIFNEYFEINICICDDNIKMDIKETSFVYRLNSSLQQGQSGFLRNINEVILLKNS